MTHQENRRGIIYKAINQINGKCYIGKTTQVFEYRIKAHYSLAFIQNSDVAFHRALRKYGKKNFEWFVISFFDKNVILKLNGMEMFFIKKYDSMKNGYNMTEGGEGTYGNNPFGNKNEEELKLWKEKLCIAQKKRVKSKNYINAMKGKKHDDEWRKKASIRKQEIVNSPDYVHPMKNKKHSKETKKKMSNAHIGRIITNKTRKKMSIASTGRKHSEETKKKLSDIKKQRPGELNYNYRSDIKIENILELKNRNFKIAEIAKQLNCTHSLIKQRLKAYRKVI